MATETLATPRRSSLWTDQKFRSIFFQALTIGLLGFAIAYIAHNTATNLENRGIASGFGFLSNTAGYELENTLIPYDSTDTHFRAFLVGLTGTLFVAFFGCIFATVFGFILGVLRLSHNFLINRVAYTYVEIVRNVPLLLQIFVWWAILLALPVVRESFYLGSGMYFYNGGLKAPSPIFGDFFWMTPVALFVAIGAAIGIRRWAKKRQDATGQTFPAFWTGLGLIFALPVMTFFATGAPLEWEVPTLGRFRFSGGLAITDMFLALLIALAAYTAAFIAEIVRAGILAVSKGQTEAAYALGIKPSWTLRLVVIPQALRVIVPPLTSQYLNLTKNSSLGAFIGYPELVATIGGITLNQTGQAVECILITMAVYLTISLSISAFMNWYNRSIALVER